MSQPPSMTYHDAWYWEGNVQAAVARFLNSDGWTIKSVADTQLKTPGPDIVAVCRGTTLLIEVKGIPSATYADPRRANEAKRSNPATQASHWFGAVVLRAIRRLTAQPAVLVACALPVYATYDTLLAETRPALERLGIGVLLASEEAVWWDLRPTTWAPDAVGKR